jgi:hypothetical protein
MLKNPVNIYSIFLLLAIIAGAVSCKLITGPDFDNAPQIKPKPHRLYENRIDSRLGNRIDSLVLVLHFQDGDGDLGLTSEDRQNNPKYQQFTADGTPNDYYYNYFVTVERRVNGQFVKAYADVPFSGAFPPLKPDGKPGPIEGDLEYSLIFPLFSSPPNDTLRFNIQIVDRELRRSNSITTDPVVINARR